MCEPATLATLSQVASVAGTVVSVAGAYQQGRQQRAVADYNARVQENEATRVRNIGIEEENEQRQRTAQLISRQRAQLAASGVELDTGSALAIQEDTALLGEIDALRIRENVQEQASAIERGAELTRAEGRAQQRAGTTRAFGSLLSGTAKIADKWYSQDSLASA